MYNYYGLWVVGGTLQRLPYSLDGTFKKLCLPDKKERLGSGGWVSYLCWFPSSSLDAEHAIVYLLSYATVR